MNAEPTCICPSCGIPCGVRCTCGEEGIPPNYFPRIPTMPPREMATGSTRSGFVLGLKIASASHPCC